MWKIKKNIKHKGKKIFLAFWLLIFFLSILYAALAVYFNDKFIPNSFVAGIKVDGRTKNFLRESLSFKKDSLKQITTQIVKEEGLQTHTIPLTEIDFSVDMEKTVNKAFEKGHNKNIFQNFPDLVFGFFNKNEVDMVLSFDQEKLNAYISSISGTVSEDPIFPSVTVVGKEIIVEKGKIGKEVNSEKLRADIKKSLSILDPSPVFIQTIVVDPTIDQSQAVALEENAKKLFEKSISLELDSREYKINGQTLISFLWPSGGFDENTIFSQVEKTAKEIEREAINPTFVFENGKVNEFTPATDGIILQKEKLKDEITKTLSRILTTTDEIPKISIPVTRIPPKVQTSEVNDLGIKERIGQGISHFRGSIASRIHNISLASSRMNGLLIPPGETFSFNSALGDVSKFTGYKEAYIIQDGKTVLGDGGGVCQVSTTLFRAAMNAGLPIAERRGHSYRVGYYEQGFPPGLDATVYSPTTDFKIRNDTPAHILIQTNVDRKTSTLTFDLYGTSDGRVAKISKTTLSDVVPPPDDLYTDDPTLPVGQIKQVEYKAWGSKAKFSYSVERGGETIFSRTFITNYKPWGAVYLKGVGPIQ